MAAFLRSKNLYKNTGKSLLAKFPIKKKKKLEMPNLTRMLLHLVICREESK